MARTSCSRSSTRSDAEPRSLRAKPGTDAGSRVRVFRRTPATAQSRCADESISGNRRHREFAPRGVPHSLRHSFASWSLADKRRYRRGATLA
jgi:integrase